MTKEEMVHKLVSFSVQAALAEKKRYWLSDLFERGFAGYRNYSPQQLRRELQLRGLDGEPGGEDADWEDDDWEEDDGDEDDGGDFGAAGLQLDLHTRDE